MPHSFRLFWIPGLLAFLLASLAQKFHLAMRFPFLDHQLTKPGMPGFFASAVLLVAVWSLLALLFRRIADNAERRVIRAVGRSLGEYDGSYNADPFWTKNVKGYGKSLFRRRYALLSARLQDHNRSERMGLLMAGQAGVDAAHTQGAYGPLRGLVWLLPSLGFMGTAGEMATAVGGLGSAIGSTSNYDELRNVLVTNVVSHLAGAFDVTVLALGASVVCFLFLSLVNTQEDATLAEADAVSLRLLSNVEDKALAAPPQQNWGAPDDEASPHGALSKLSVQIEQLNSMLSQPDYLQKLTQSLGELQQAGGVTTLIPALSSITTCVSQMGMSLENIRANLEQERVFVPRSALRDDRGGAR
jgi:hypothetical protein